MIKEKSVYIQLFNLLNVWTFKIGTIISEVFELDLMLNRPIK